MRTLATAAMTSLGLLACDAPDQLDPGTLDLDGDGVLAAEDCNDGDARIYPGNTEICDGVDNNCDAVIDDGDDRTTYYADADNDGFGDPAASVSACAAPDGHVTDNTDCDDRDGRFNPLAAESDCTDPNDYNCDGSVGYADADKDGVPACEDCADDDAAVRPDAEEVCNDRDDNCDRIVDLDAVDRRTFFPDADGDRYGNLRLPVLACEAPAGHVEAGGDCDDAAPATFPGATERCDGLDNSCDGSPGADEVDADKDDFLACEECNDKAAAVYPGADETCNKVDDDCDGSVDEASAIDATSWYADSDADGYGASGSSLRACAAPKGYVGRGDDCDDKSADVNPGEDERCNSVDDDCDGSVDEAGAVDAKTWYLDADKDGYGLGSSATRACASPKDHVERLGDCDDKNKDVNPGEDELCNKLDDDCDGSVDEAGAVDAGAWYLDADRDGWGLASKLTRACAVPTDHVDRAGDCDDSNKAANPGEDELCSTTFDDDCDGRINEPSAIDTSDWFKDADTDGYGDRTARTSACVAPSGYVADDRDCRDTDALVSPAASERCSTLYDDDCDGTINEADAVDTRTWFVDADGDKYGNGKLSTKACLAPTGYVEDDADCDDADEDTYPGADDVCDGADNDCSGTPDDDDAYLGSEKLCPAETCQALLTARSGAKDGVYWIDPSGAAPASTYCDMTTDGGGWTLASYAYNGATSTSSSNYNHWSLKCGGGTFTPESRGTSSAALPSVDLARASTEMAISMNLSGASVTTGNMAAYDRAYSFPIPDPSAVTFVNHAYNGGYWGSGSGQAGSCVAVTVQGLVGDTGSYTRYTLKHSLGATWTDSFPTGYGATARPTCYGSVGSYGGPFVTSYHSGDGWSGSHGLTVKSCDIATAGRTQYLHYGTWSATGLDHTGSHAIWFR